VTYVDISAMHADFCMQSVVSPARGHWGTCPPLLPNREPTIQVLCKSARLADADVNNSQVFQSVLH